MLKRMGLNHLIFLLLVLGGTPLIEVHASEMPKKTNVVLIIVNNLKPALGFLRDTYAQTPCLDRLACSSFVFENNHSQQAVCSSSRASLLTGMRPDYIMVWDMNTPIRNMIPNIVTMPQLFMENGYETAAIGNVFDPISVDVKHDSLSWSVPYKNLDGFNIKSTGWVSEKDTLITQNPEVMDSQTQDGKILLESIKQLDRFTLTDKPFFLVVGFQKPHLPFVAPKKYWDLFNPEKIQLSPFQEYADGTPSWVYQTPWDPSIQYVDMPKNGLVSTHKQKELIQGYYACVSFIDEKIGTLIDHLEKRGLRENTIIVICGDHGIHLGDHGLWGKQSNLEAGTHTPLIISHGSKYTGETNAPTELLDIFPTLCELVGISTMESLDGKSLLPLMNGSKTTIKPFSVSQISRLHDLMGYAFRSERYRYVVWLKNNFRSYMNYSPDLIISRELYDYQADPLETINLINHKEYENVVRSFESLSVNFFIDQQKSNITESPILND